ncbi:MAG: hypothetical protein Kow00109_21050 [Acidobacteriota bacterium]
MRVVRVEDRFQVTGFRCQEISDHGCLGCRAFQMRNAKPWSAAAEGRRPGAAALDVPVASLQAPQLRTTKAAGRLRLPAALHISGATGPRPGRLWGPTRETRVVRNAADATRG